MDFLKTNEVPNQIEKRQEWVKVDNEVNELERHFP